jgi:gliding motility-associated-like protein
MKYFSFLFFSIALSINSLAIIDGGGPCFEFRAIAECDPAISPNSIRIDITAPVGVTYMIGVTTYAGNTSNIGITGPFLIDMNNNPLAFLTGITGSGTITITNFRCYSGGAFTGLLCTDNVSLSKSFSGGTQPVISGGTGSYAPGASVSLTSTCLTGTLNWYTSSCGGTIVGTGSPYTSTAMSTTTYYARCEDSCVTTSCDSQTVTRVFGGANGPGDFEWVQTAFMSDCAEESVSTDIDASRFNDLYTVGYFGTVGVAFSSTLNFGGGNSISTAPNTGIDNFITKYDSSGNNIWVGKISTSNNEGKIVRTATDLSGNLFVTAKLRDDPSNSTGSISSSGTIMGTALSQSVLPNDGILAKLDSAGNVLWQRQFRGTSNVHLTDVATDAGGNVYVCGGYKNGSFTIDGNTHFGGTQFKSFIAKFSSTGISLWWKEATTENNLPHRLHVDGINVYCFGLFYGGSAMTIEGQTFSASFAQPIGHYLIKYSNPAIATANFDWVRSGYGNQIDLILSESPQYTGYEMTGDATGNIYLVHSLRRTNSTNVQYDYNGSPLSFTSASGSNGCRAYVFSKYNSSGTLVSISGDGIPASSSAYYLKFDGLAYHPNGFIYGTATYSALMQINDTVFTSQADKESAILELDLNLDLNSRYEYGVGIGPTGHISEGAGIAIKPNGSLGYAGNITRPSSGGLPTLTTTYDGFDNGVCGTDKTSLTGSWIPDVCAPPIISGSTSDLCESSTRTFTTINAGPGPVWTVLSGGGSITAGGVYTPANVSVNTTVQVEHSFSCAPNARDTVTFTVVPVLSQPSPIVGSAAVCAGNSYTYSVTNVAGASYTWGYTGGGTPSSTTNSVTFTPASSGNLFVNATNTCGTSSNTSLNISASTALSQPSTITGNTNICSSSQTYSVTSVPGSTYAWSYGGGGTATSTTNSVTFTPTSTGTLSVTATNTCGTSSARTLVITVDAAAPAQPSIISGTTPICTSSQTYAVTNVVGVTYAWSYSGGGTATSTANTVTFTPTSNGTLSVTATNACGTSSASTLAVVVDATAPSQPSAISGATPICSSSQTYSVTSEAGVTYAWSYSGGGTATSTTNSVTFTPTSNGTLSVTATNACGTSSASTLAITVLSGAPAQPSAITGNANVCSTSETYTVTNVVGVSYSWTYSGTGSLSSITNSVSFTPTSNGTLSVTATNACGTSSAQTLVITVESGIPTQPTAISGPTNVCSNSPQTYSTVNVASVTYAWSYSGGGNPTGTINSTTFTPTSSGTLSVTATNACGTSSPENLSLVIGTSTPVTPGAITGATTVCSSSQTYGIVPVTGAASYNWSFTGGGIASSTSATVTFTPTSSGVLSVSATNPCGTSAASTLNITVDNGVPVTPSPITGNTIVCDNSLQTYSVTNVIGLTYTWSYSGVGSPSSTTNTVSFTPTSSGILSVIATNSCGSSAQSAANITVNVLPPVSLGSDQAICATSLVNLSVPSNALYTYLWSDGTTTNTFSANPNLAQNIWVRVTNSFGCVVTDSLNITITGPSTINANDDSISVLSDRLDILDVTNNDSQIGNLSIINNPQFGIANIDNNGKITYKSYIDYIGNDVLTYEICDVFCSLTCDTATVFMKVEHNVFENTDNGNIGSWGVTPNGDGINDVLLIDGLFEYPYNEITIYNRWGDKIYYAKPYNQDWNGINPDEIVNGTYFFILELEGQPDPFKGFVHLQK